MKGVKKEQKLLEKSSKRFLGPGCRDFESRHSDQKSRIRFCGVWAFSHLCIKTIYQKNLIWLPCYVQLVYCYSVIVEKEIILW